MPLTEYKKLHSSSTLVAAWSSAARGKFREFRARSITSPVKEQRATSFFARTCVEQSCFYRVLPRSSCACLDTATLLWRIRGGFTHMAQNGAAQRVTDASPSNISGGHNVSGGRSCVNAEECADMPQVGAAYCGSELKASPSTSGGNYYSGDRSYVGAVECVHDREASTSDTNVLRCSFSDAATAEQWVKSYSEETNTTWIIGDVKTGCSRYTRRLTQNIIEVEI